MAGNDEFFHFSFIDIYIFKYNIYIYIIFVQATAKRTRRQCRLSYWKFKYYYKINNKKDKGLGDENF